MESPSLLFRFRELRVRFRRSHRFHFPPRHEPHRQLQVLLPAAAARVPRVPRVPLLARSWFPPASPGTWIPASPQAFFQAPIFLPARLPCPSLALLPGPFLAGPPGRFGVLTGVPSGVPSGAAPHRPLPLGGPSLSASLRRPFLRAGNS